ncbi:MAG: GGDEF domain-containing protein [Planctomycetes bacterium]|nr:GGDEF domain-containing protein [Planctomycetota bacterium]
MNLLRRIRWGYLVILVPVATDWIDAGHFPLHPREVVTEVIVGLLLGAFVGALYRDADRYRTLSETDPLTGLPNRRRFEDDLAREVRRAGEAPLAVAFADVDAFMEINDTRGHEAGESRPEVGDDRSEAAPVLHL